MMKKTMMNEEGYIKLISPSSLIFILLTHIFSSPSLFIRESVYPVRINTHPNQKNRLGDLRRRSTPNSLGILLRRRITPRTKNVQLLPSTTISKRNKKRAPNLSMGCLIFIDLSLGNPSPKTNHPQQHRNLSSKTGLLHHPVKKSNSLPFHDRLEESQKRDIESRTRDFSSSPIESLEKSHSEHQRGEN